MPRESPYVITLSKSEAQELRRRAAQYTLPYFQVQRAKMILFAAEGLTNDDIARRLDARREVVSLWRKRFFADRPRRFGRTGSSGSPPDFFPQTSSFRLRLWPVNFPPLTVCLCLVGAPAIWFSRSWFKCVWNAVQPCRGIARCI